MSGSDSCIKRNFGLDIIRSLAILMVVIGHIIPDQTLNEHLLNTALMLRGYGVELFFVLSGFLIGKILIKFFNEDLNISNIKNFYIRRWFRTLPLYYLYFFLCLVFIKIFNPETNIFSFFYLKYLFFIQNFDIRHLAFFNHSWSLSIEEWFYLLLPLVLLIIKDKAKIFKTTPSDKKFLYIDLIKIIIFIALIRFFYVYITNVPNADFGIRRQIPIRFDALLTGVLFACLKINNKEIFNNLLQKKYLIISFIVLILITFNYYGFHFYFSKTLFGDLQNLLFYNTFYWSFVPLAFSFIIIFFETSKFINIKLPKFSLIKNFFEKTSLYSYSMYFFSYNIIIFYRVFYLHFEQSWLHLLFCMIIIYIVSSLVYKYIEKPMMNLRDRF